MSQSAHVSTVAIGIPAPTEASHGEIVDHAWMQDHRRAWERLAAEAVTPNPFYAPLVLEAHMAHRLLHGSPRFAIVRRAGRLQGLLPLSARPMRLGWLGRAAGAVHSPYMVSSTPLISPGNVDETCDSLLDALASVSRGLWAFPLFRLDDPVGQAFRSALSRRGWVSATPASFARAVLDRRPAYADFALTLAARRRKDLGRRQRRLRELGRLTLSTDLSGQALTHALEDFLALEASGWKGARGSALASRRGTAAYARALTTEPSEAVQVRLDRLMLDDRPIAGSIALLSGGTAYLYKTAYDETLARYAPGVLLEHEIVRSLHETAFAARLNSASLAGSLLDSIFPDREQVGDLVFSADPATQSGRLKSLLAQDAWRKILLERAKNLYQAMRGRRQSAWRA